MAQRPHAPHRDIEIASGKTPQFSTWTVSDNAYLALAVVTLTLQMVAVYCALDGQWLPSILWAAAVVPAVACDTGALAGTHANKITFSRRAARALVCGSLFSGVLSLGVTAVLATW